MADLFDIVVARKLSGGGGGTTVEALSVTQNGTYTAPSGKAYSPVSVNVSGGSSDFSTADVTITVNNGYAVMTGSFIGADEFGHQDITLGSCFVTDSTQTFPIVLTSTGALVSIADSNLGNAAISGNISDLGNFNFLVTGDCTIIIS